MTKPQKLASLDANIPQLAKRLLSSTGENDDFEFIPWKPSSSDRPILIPVSPTTNTHEDAMEAILEEMEEFNCTEFTIGDIVRSGFVRSYLINKIKLGIGIEL